MDFALLRRLMILDSAGDPLLILRRYRSFSVSMSIFILVDLKKVVCELFPGIDGFRKLTRVAV